MSKISFEELLNAGVEIFGLACEHKCGVEGGGICVSTHCEPHSELVYVARSAHNEPRSIRTESVKDLYLCEGAGIFCANGGTAWYRIGTFTGFYTTHDRNREPHFTCNCFYPPIVKAWWEKNQEKIFPHKDLAKELIEAAEELVLTCDQITTKRLESALDELKKAKEAK